MDVERHGGRGGISATAMEMSPVPDSGIFGARPSAELVMTPEHERDRRAANPRVALAIGLNAQSRLTLRCVAASSVAVPRTGSHLPQSGTGAATTAVAVKRQAQTVCIIFDYARSSRLAARNTFRSSSCNSMLMASAAMAPSAAATITHCTLREQSPTA